MKELHESLDACQMMGYSTTDFLRCWFGGCNSGSILFVRRIKKAEGGSTYKAVKGFRTDQISEATAFVESFPSGDDLFIKTSTFNAEKITARMNRGEVVVGNKHELDTVLGIAMDCDAGKRDSYASQADVWVAIHQMPVPPTMVVLSGESNHGFHVYWKLSRPIKMQSAHDVELMNQRARAWRDLLCDKIAEVLSSRGVVDFVKDKLVDRTYGVDRVLRPVGAIRKAAV